MEYRENDMIILVPRPLQGGNTFIAFIKEQKDKNLHYFKKYTHPDNTGGWNTGGALYRNEYQVRHLWRGPEPITIKWKRR